DMDALNALTSQRDRITIKAKLLKETDLYQEETPYVDVSEYRDLILDLLVPAGPSSFSASPYSHICQLQIDGEDGPLMSLAVVWIKGTSPLLVANRSAQCYSRTGRYRPVGPDKYVDEPPVLCGLIKAVIEKDEDARSHYVSKLRQSLGVSQGE